MSKIQSQNVLGNMLKDGWDGQDQVFFGAVKICRAVLVAKILPYNMKFAEVILNLLSGNSCQT